MPSNTGQSGIDIRQTGGGQLVVRTFWTKTSGAALETSATVTLSIFELQSDGTLKTFEFAAGGNQYTFQSGAVTTPTTNMTYVKGNNNTLDTGIRTYSLATLTGFTKGAIYMVQCNNPSADVQWQTREFQFGGAQGDLTVDTHNNLNANSHDAGGTAITAGAIPAVVAGANGGLPTVDASNQVKANVTAMAANVLTATAINAAALNGKGDWLLASGYVAQTGDSYAFLTTALTESYAAKGDAPTFTQILCEMRANLCELGIVGTTFTANKINGSTVAATYTLNSPTTPTSKTRAT